MLRPLDWTKGHACLLSLPLSMDLESVALNARGRWEGAHQPAVAEGLWREERLAEVREQMFSSLWPED